MIFGTGSTAEKLIENLNDNINVICYLDNNKLRWGKYLNERIVLSPNEINKIKYDYIVIASQFCNDIFTQLILNGVCEHKIFEYLNFLNDRNNPFKYKIKIFENNKFEYKTLITGISYFVSGINGDKLKYKGMNFAFDSQDLYYDYNIVKYILEKKENQIKNVIIGLSYYSFQYDLSLSSMKDNVNLYYQILEKNHNLKFKRNYDNRIIINRHIAECILNKSNNKQYMLKNKFIPLTEQFVNLSELGKKQAYLDCNKNYPKTVIENKKIFCKYLELLVKYNVEPIVVICPTSKYYYKNFSKRIKYEFFTIMAEMKKNYNFQYIDYFESELFDDSLFYDVSHLTFEGGMKFTEILNKEIKW
ncbi:chemotaxis protein [Clostridium butyricum]|uniref:chemotaxis protein n=1 Tax=Clostridium butyricum TaxID=1492 RepID=UPI00374E8FED